MNSSGDPVYSEIFICILQSIYNRNIKHGWYGRGMAWDSQEMYTGFWWANLKKKGHSENLGIYEAMILRLILKW